MPRAMNEQERVPTNLTLDSVLRMMMGTFCA